MQQKFAIAAEDVVTTGFYRANLNLLVEPVSGADKQRRLEQWLGAKAGQPSIVYVTQQKTAEQVASRLSQRGFAASAYHAGMAADAREAMNRPAPGITSVNAHYDHYRALPAAALAQTVAADTPGKTGSGVQFVQPKDWTAARTESGSGSEPGSKEDARSPSVRPKDSSVSCSGKGRSVPSGSRFAARWPRLR